MSGDGTRVSAGTVVDDEHGRLVFVEIRTPCCGVSGAQMSASSRAVLATALISSVEEVEYDERAAAGLLAKFLEKERDNG